MSIFLQFKKNISFSTICLVNVPDISCVFFSPSISNTHFLLFFPPLAKPYVTMLVILSKLLSERGDSCLITQKNFEFYKSHLGEQSQHLS